MTKVHLDALRETLFALPEYRAALPTRSVCVVLQETSDLLELLHDEPLWRKLTAVGLDPCARERLEFALGAARSAHASWMEVRDEHKSEPQVVLEHRGDRTRRELAAAIRWNLRHDFRVLERIARVGEGESTEDLVRDIHLLASVMEQQLHVFLEDKSFDASATVQEARALGREISLGLTHMRPTVALASAKDLRDRALSYLDEFANTIREAGQYAFRDIESLRRRFMSSHLPRPWPVINSGMTFIDDLRAMPSATGTG